MSEPNLTIDQTSPSTVNITTPNRTELRNSSGMVFQYTSEIDLTRATTILVIQTADLNGAGAFIPANSFNTIIEAINTSLTQHNRQLTFVSAPIQFNPDVPDEGYQYRVLCSAHIKGMVNNE